MSVQNRIRTPSHSILWPVLLKFRLFHKICSLHYIMMNTLMIPHSNGEEVNHGNRSNWAFTIFLFFEIHQVALSPVWCGLLSHTVVPYCFMSIYVCKTCQLALSEKQHVFIIYLHVHLIVSFIFNDENYKQTPHSLSYESGEGCYPKLSSLWAYNYHYITPPSMVHGV